MELQNKDNLSEALKLLKEMRSVNTQKALHRFQGEIETQPSVSRSFVWLRIRNTAAILIPALLILNAWLMFRSPAEDPSAYLPRKMEITAMNGSNIYYTLPDNSTVWLRGGSKMIYDAHMMAAKERKVEVIGEAYFEVEKDEKKPFIVKLKDIDVKVVGTEFNCSTDYTDQIQVTLAEGQVDMIKHAAGGSVFLTTLTPGRHFYYNTKQNTYGVKEVDVRKYTGWKDGILLFDGDPMTEVAERISNWYGVDIVIADKEIEKMHFTGGFDNLKLGQIIDIIELSSDMTSTYIHGKIDENGVAIKDRLILRSKK